jgi:hypothetical protein
LFVCFKKKEELRTSSNILNQKSTITVKQRFSDTILKNNVKPGLKPMNFAWPVQTAMKPLLKQGCKNGFQKKILPWKQAGKEPSENV